MRKYVFLISILLAALFCSAAAYADNTVNKSSQTILSPENVKSDATQNAPVFAIEDCRIDEVRDDSFSFKAKIRNITNEDIDDFTLDYQVLDGKGDVLCSHGFILHNIGAGQGMWSFAVRVGDADFEEVAAIRFVSATTGNPYKYVPLLEKSTFYINDNSPSRDQVDDPSSDAKTEPKSISLNESISTDTVEFMLESCEYRDEVRYTTASKAYTRVFGAQADGVKYYVVEGKIKNLLTEARDISKITAALKMDDTYSYSVKVFIINPDNKGTASSAEPLIEYKLVLFAAVPDSFADGTHSGEWCFGFNDTFEKLENAPQDCDNVFVLETK